jgi:mannonate dehydratase
MKIANIETLLTCPDRNYLIVKITTDGGLVGYGDATLNGREKAVQSLIENHLRPWLVGWDAEAIEKIWQSTIRQQYWRGGAIQMTALAGIDMALWDIKGKNLGAPVYSLLGGKSRDHVRVYLHVHGDTDEALIDRCLEIISTGCTALRYSFDTVDPFEQDLVFRQAHQDVSSGKRIEVTREALRNPPRWDSGVYARDLLRVTKLLRERLGPDVLLIHDLHQRTTPIQAADIAKKLEAFDLFSLEDPVDSHYPEGLGMVRQSTTTPIGIGELWVTLEECLPALRNNWIDFLRMDISHSGGISGVVKASTVAEAFHVRMAFHGPSDISPLAHAAHLHVDTAILNFGIQEFTHPQSGALRVFDCGFEYSDGKVFLGSRPGLGVEVDEESAALFPYRESFLPLLQGRDGGVHNW